MNLILLSPGQKKSLNRRITINSLQRLLIRNGFTLLHWSETIGNTENIKFLNKDTLLKIQENYNDVSLADLLASNITFIARKTIVIETKPTNNIFLNID